MRKVGKGSSVFGVPLDSRARDLSPSRSDLPHTQQPYPVEPLRCDGVEEGVRYVIERSVPAERGEENLGLYLVEAGIHRSSILSVVRGA